MCNPEESLHNQLVAETIHAEEQRELELDQEVADRRKIRKPLRVTPRVIPFSAICDWDAYR